MIRVPITMNWLNVSYNDPSVRHELDRLCGKPFGLLGSLRKGGTGSPRLLLVDASHGLMSPFERHEDRYFASLEMRPLGLVLRCRSLLETLALPLPHGQLADVMLCAAGQGAPAMVRILTHGGEELVLHVAQEHWAGLNRLLVRALPGSLLRGPDRWH